MAAYSVSARGLSVGYDGQAVLRDIRFDIAKGEIVTLIRPNGAGKSTLLKSIARQLRTLAGTVEIGGLALSALPAHELATRMAVVLTERVRPELMTCRDVVAAGRYPYTGRLGILSPEDERQVDAAMRAVRALELSGRDFNAVSDGQRQRVLLARAICQQPEIIVLDEPTSFLDIRHKLELLDILKRMSRGQGITVVMSLHEIDLAQKVSDKILCVEEESVARYGTPEQVFTGEGIRALYRLEEEAYDPLFGGIELPRIEGEPQAFVLSACGTGIPVYRALQRRGVPFAAGGALPGRRGLAPGAAAGRGGGGTGTLLRAVRRGVMPGSRPGRAGAAGDRRGRGHRQRQPPRGGTDRRREGARQI